MQKVSKEYVEDFVKKTATLPKQTQCPIANSKKTDIFDLETLRNLIVKRELTVLSELSQKTMKNMGNLYQSWMLEESNLIQDVAMIYGERYALEESIKACGKKQ